MATIDTLEKECVQFSNALTLDAWLPRLTPARVRCSLPAAAVVVRSRAAAAAALATLAQRAPLAF